MKVYIVEVLVDDVAWETLQIYKTHVNALRRVKELSKMAKTKRRIYQITSMEVKP